MQLLIIPMMLYLIYHAFNVYMDCKYRITKNWWHLLFVTIGAVYIYATGSYTVWYSPWISMLAALGMGLCLEWFGQSSPGDTKMMATSAFLLAGAMPSVFYLHVAFGIVVMHLLLFIIYTYLYLIVKQGPIHTLKEQINTIKMFLMPGMPIDRTKIFDHFPGATTIMGGGILYMLANAFSIF